ncbi:uncharacterized protein AKAME5_002612000 [Lates japonicus]|uniref:SCAN box domain-containing protein n=1 Tax=Lates japonicus TaxID=270547 RepID=A0AAD3NKP4_LATJO|nr:uncharacterized protein AKAME5_002612000 [Lates japonicus]
MGLMCSRICAWSPSFGSETRVHTYEALYDPVVLEQFKNLLPSSIATFVVEHKVKTAAEAAALADEYVLTQRGDHEHRARDGSDFRGDGSKSRPAGKRWEETAGPRHATPEKATRSQLYYNSKKPDKSAQCFPSVFTACAVTRAMRRRESEPGAEQSDTEGNEAPAMSIPNSLLSVSRGELAQEQSSDPSLSELFHMVLPGANGMSAARGYILQDQELVLEKGVAKGHQRLGFLVTLGPVCH